MTDKTIPLNSIEMLHSEIEIAKLLAEETGLNRESLYKAFGGKSQPQRSTVHKLLHALGFSYR